MLPILNTPIKFKTAKEAFVFANPRLRNLLLPSPNMSQKVELKLLKDRIESRLNIADNLRAKIDEMNTKSENTINSIDMLLKDFQEKLNTPQAPDKKFSKITLNKNISKFFNYLISVLKK